MSDSLDEIAKDTKTFLGKAITPKIAKQELLALLKGGQERDNEFNYNEPVFLDFSIFDKYLSFLETERKKYDSYKRLVRLLKAKYSTPVLEEYDRLLPEKLQEYDKGKEKVGIYKETLDRRLKYDYSIFLNSSIWFRSITKSDDDAEAKKNESIKNELKYFNELGLYDYSSAIEYFDFNCRRNKNNFLNSSSVAGHGNFVTPILYGNELESLEVLRKNCIPYSNDNDITFNFFKEFHDVALRILVVDDKVGNCKEQSFLSISKGSDIKIYDCKSYESCDKQCKLKTIRQLMDDGGKDEDIKALKQAIFSGIGEDKDYFYWNEKDIKCYFCPDVMKDFIDDENERGKLRDKDFQNIKFTNGDEENGNPEFVDFNSEGSKGKVQLVGVRDVRTALLLLSHYKFDMIFFDYLLDKKDKDSEERDFSLQFFKFLSEKDKHQCEALKKLRRAVLDNRGPLDKFWIMPITGFNDTFIADLNRNGVPLISSKWHIDNGADPITTPWQFLNKLNRFIELQLKGCLYKREKLLQFLQYTGEDLKEHFHEVFESNDDKNRMNFWEFQAFMGAEYSSFMSHYGSRLVIKRDAVTGDSEKNMTDKSVFATYIWANFYKLKNESDAKEKQDKKLLFGLHNQMTKFYQVAASMPDDHNGMERIREAFRSLRYYVDSNRLANNCSRESGVTPNVTPKSMEDALKHISNCIGKLEA